MEAFDYAIQMETDGEHYYRELASKSPDRGLASILSLLADAEVRHRQILEQMKRNAPPQLSQPTISSDVKNIFAQMRDRQEDVSVDTTQVELYSTAKQLERKSEEFYSEQAAAATDLLHKEVFQRFAEEEHKHAVIIENLIELITRPEPGNWLENAEWHHLDEY